MAEDEGKRRRYVPAKERNRMQQAKAGQTEKAGPAEDGRSPGFPTPGMDTSKYRVPPKPGNRNDKLLIALSIFLAACLVIGLVALLVGGPQSQRLAATASPDPSSLLPSAAPTPLKVTAAPAITPVPTASYTLLKEGSEGEEVARVQRRLIELGYLQGEADGKYGRATNRAVQGFQKEAGLDVDGMTGAKTAEALFAATAPVAPSPTGAAATGATATDAAGESTADPAAGASASPPAVVVVP